MSEHQINLLWTRSSEDFSYKKYNREHHWTFKNGEKVEASAAVAYLGKDNCVDPEEAFVASLTSCHMLTFLAIASMQGFTVDRYEDNAVGFLNKNEQGKLAITEIKLNPNIVFSGDKQPSAEDIKTIHEKAHKECFLANSVTSKISVTH